MIKAIIFDIGGVVVRDNPYWFLKKFERAAGQPKEFLYDHTIGSYEWTVLYNKGRISWKDLWRRLEKKIVIKHKIFRDIRRGWRDAVLQPVPETIQLLQELKNNYKIYAISNVDRDTVRYMKRKYKLYNIFDGVVLSCDVKLIKPGLGIFRVTLRRFGLRPSECIFIDNKLANVKAAERLGIKSIHFKSPEKLKIALERLGIRLS